MEESAEKVYGRLTEAVHIAGYSLERAIKEFDWLLENDRWKICGNRFDDINDFLATISLSEFKLSIEQRKSIAKKLAELRASQRATAKALGVSQMTVHGDLKNEQNFSLPGNKVNEYQDLENVNEQNFSLPSSITRTGSEVVNLADKKKRNDKSRKTPDLKKVRVTEGLRQGDFREVLQDIPNSSVSLILTDPPYGKNYLTLWRDLGRFAARVLADNGILISYAGQMYLTEMIAMLSESLDYWWCGMVSFGTGGNLTPLGNPVRKVINQCKPILMFVKKRCGYDRVFRDLIIGAGKEKDCHNWQQSLKDAITIIEQFSNEGDLVVDPFAGSNTTGLACQQTNRKYMGAEILEWMTQ